MVIFINQFLMKIGEMYGSPEPTTGGNALKFYASTRARLDKTITVTTTANITFGRYLTIGTEETGSTFYEANERCMVVSSTGAVVTIIGEGANGGLRFGHDSGVAVRNADSVYPVAVGSSQSMAKLYASETGPFGEVVGPKVQGLADQFQSLAFKFYGGYGLWRENCIVRGEFASSLDNVASAMN